MTSSPHLPDFLLPAGFQFAAVKAGLKPSGKPDFAIAVADDSCLSRGHVHQQPHRRRAHHRRPRTPPAVARPRQGRRRQRRQRQLRHRRSRNRHLPRSLRSSRSRIRLVPNRKSFPPPPESSASRSPERSSSPRSPKPKSALGKTSGHFDQFAHAILTTDTRRKVSARHFAVAASKSRSSRRAKAQA